MRDVRRLGGVAAWLQTAAYVLTFAFILIIWPRYGVTGPDQAADPAVMLPALRRAPALAAFGLLDVLIGLCMPAVALALARCLRSAAPRCVRVATASGLVAAGAFIALGLIRSLAWGRLAGAYGHDPVRTAASYVRLSRLDNAIDGAALLALGAWVLGSSLVALRERLRSRSRWLHYLGVCAGATALVGGLVAPARPAALVLVLIWTLGVGAMLRRGQ